MSTNKIRIEAFDPARHDYGNFDCGVERLNDFILLSAKKRQKQDMIRVFAAVFAGQNEVIGYYSTRMSYVDIGAVSAPPKGLPAHAKIPVLFLEHLAVSLPHQGQNTGSLLVQSVFKKALKISQATGCHAIVLDVISDGSESDFINRKRFYEKSGFASLKHPPKQMYITLEKVRRSIALAEK